LTTFQLTEVIRMQLMNDEFLPIVRKGKKEEEEGQMLGFGLVHIVATYF